MPEYEPMPLKTAISPACAPALASAKIPAAAIVNHVLILSSQSAWCRCTGTKRFARFLPYRPTTIIGGYRPAAKLDRKLAHQAVEARLTLEPNPWALGQRQIAAVNAGIV